jgi:putative ABC transport system ATP-binding protein
VTTPPLLRLVDVTVDRPVGPATVRALERFSLDLAGGEMVALMGPSGSGKTTAIDVACGLVTPTDGSVVVDGETVVATGRRAWAARRRRLIGVVHQRLDLLPGLDALDNVALPLLLDHVPVRRAHDRARAALDRVGLGHAAGRGIGELSGGERQRVAVARAVVGDRKVVLADEPTAALDTVAAEEIVRLLASLAEAGTAVLMATHDTRLAGWADRVEHLRDGRQVGAVGSSTASRAGAS